MEDSFYPWRLERVHKILASYPLDGILFSSLENIRYLCGFTGSDGALVVTQQDSFFLTDSRYWTQSEEEVRESKVVRYRKKMEGIATLLSDLNMKAIGFESAYLPFSAHQFLSQKLTPQATFIPLEDELKNIRALKDQKELDILRTAIEIASDAFLNILELLNEGVVEREVASEMEWFMKRKGAEALGFDIIVASGKRSALPHGKAGDKRIERGDLIVMDFGSRFEGYHSDQTRTVACGNLSSEQQKIYQIVKEAHDKAIEKVKPGIPIGEVDAAARDHIRNQGYGDYFGHGTGHGIGLAVHEDPVVNSDNKAPVQEGMVFTIEPGIYVPDWGGVRIEDMILVTAQGAEVLTYLPAEVKVI